MLACLVLAIEAIFAAQSALRAAAVTGDLAVAADETPRSRIVSETDDTSPDITYASFFSESGGMVVGQWRTEGDVA